MADASLKIDIDVTGERQLNQLQRDMIKTGVLASGLNSRLSSLGKGTSKLEQVATKGAVTWKRYFGELDKLVVGFGKAINKGMGLAIKLFTGEIAVMGASMVAMHGLLALGPKLIKVWTGTLNVAAAAAAAFASGLSVAAAAVRESQVAMFAYKGQKGDMQNLKNNMAAVRATFRGIETDAMLGAVGMQNMSAAFAEISRNAKGYTQQSQSLLKGLLDFASAGQPLDKGIKSAAQLVKILEDPKGNMSQVRKAVEALGPEAKKAFDQAKKSGITTMKELRQAISSGQFSVLGEVQGQFDTVNDTLLMRGKKIFANLKSQFADIGDTFMPEVKSALNEIGTIFQQMLFRIRGGIQHFGRGNFLEVMVRLAQKLSNILTNLFNNNLQNTEGMVGRIRNRWNSFTELMRKSAAWMGQFVDSAKILERTFGNVFRPLKKYINDSFGQLDRLVIRNEDSFLNFGTSVGNLIAGIGKFGQLMKSILVDALPFINKTLDGLLVFVRVFTDALGLLRSTFGSVFGDSMGAMQTMLVVKTLGKGMGGWKGGAIPSNVQQMTVNAGTVVISGNYGPQAPGKYGVPPKQISGGKGGSGPLSGLTSGHGKAASGGYGGGLFSGKKQAAAEAAAATAELNAQKQALFNRALGGDREAAKQLAALESATVGSAVGAGGIGKRARFGSRLKNFFGSTQGLPDKAYKPGLFNRSLGKHLAIMQNSPMGKAMKGFNASTSGRMGTSMGLGVMSSFMPQEAQGAMALGGIVANFNPMLGAAVGLGGAALNARTVKGGVLTGAGAGAAIGSLAGPGGAIAGAAVGAIAGGIAAQLNKGRLRLKKLGELSGDMITELTNGVQSKIRENVRRYGAKGRSIERVRAALNSVGTSKTTFTGLEQQSFTALNAGESEQEAFINEMFLRQKELGFTISQEDKDLALLGGDERKKFISSLYKGVQNQRLANKLITDVAQSRQTMFTGLFGKTTDELLELAEATGTNLYDAAMDTKDMVHQLAKGLIHDFAGLQGAAAELGATIMNSLDVKIRQAAAGPAMDESTEVMRQQLIAGTATTEGKLNFIKTFMGQMVDFQGGNYMAAMPEVFRLLGFGGKPGAAFTSKNNQLTGLGGKFFDDPVIMAALTEMRNDWKADESKLLAEFVSGGLANAGLALTSGGKTLTTNQMLQLAGGLDPRQQAQLGETYGRLAAGTLTSNDLPAELAKISQAFAGYELTPIEDVAGTMKAVAIKFETVTGEMSTAMESLNSAVDRLVTWLDTNGGDTRVPHGAYGDTLSKHAAVDGSIAGNRTITSGLRNFGLGSGNSDHLTGNAIDITGSNLGSYQVAMRNAGGFAEFHGAGPNRHLHTVPYASGGVEGAGGSSYNYNIAINGANMDLRQIANEVAMVIERSHRNRGERS